jgi:hypothetical protein
MGARILSTIAQSAPARPDRYGNPFDRQFSAAHAPDGQHRPMYYRESSTSHPQPIASANAQNVGPDSRYQPYSHYEYARAPVMGPHAMPAAHPPHVCATRRVGHDAPCRQQQSFRVRRLLMQIDMFVDAETDMSVDANTYVCWC